MSTLRTNTLQTLDSSFSIDVDQLSAVSLRQVTSITALQEFDAKYDGEQVELRGYYEDTPGYGGGILYWDESSVATPSLGLVFERTGVATGRWIRSNPDAITAYHWGARQAEESSTNLQAYLDWARTRGFGTVDLGNDGFFLINKPLRGCTKLRIVGRAVLRAQAPFETVTFDVFGGGTSTAGPMIYFVDAAPTSPSGTVGTIGNPTGSRRTDIYIEDTVTLDCDDIAGVGVFLDNYQYYRIDARITDPTKWGVWCYFFCWVGTIGARITGPGEGGVWLGPGCNGINLDNLLVWGDNKTPTIAGVLIDGDNNGISMNGATIEKVTYGVYLRNGFGPVDISGVDFEQISLSPIYADGSAVGSRVNGPVAVSGCFLETISLTEALIKAVNADVTVKDSRVRNAAKFVEHTSSGQVSLRNNVETGITATGTGNIDRTFRLSRSLACHNYGVVSSTLANVKEDHNFAYPYATLPSSGVSYAHQVTSGTNRTMVGSSTWYVANFNLDVETARAGLSINYTSTKELEPLTTGDHNLGNASKKFNRVVANSHVQAAGIGTAVNPLANGEMVMQFTSNTQVTIKGMGSDGVIRVANITLA